MEESETTTIERYYTLLHFTLQAKMPRKNGIHIYSTNNMLDNFKTYIREDGYELVMSEGVPYSAFAMGYREDGSKRVARNGKYSKGLEALNFMTIDNAVETCAICLAEAGGVTINGN